MFDMGFEPQVSFCARFFASAGQSMRDVLFLAILFNIKTELFLYLLSFVETLRKFIIAIINLRGVSTKLNKYIVFTMQTYKKLRTIFIEWFVLTPQKSVVNFLTLYLPDFHFLFLLSPNQQATAYLINCRLQRFSIAFVLTDKQCYFLRHSPGRWKLWQEKF